MILSLSLVLFLNLVTAVDIPKNALENLPTQQLFQPQPPPNVPIRDGERRCDNFYNGAIPPCLLRPWLPPYSYSTTEADNGEYRRRKRSGAARQWRTLETVKPGGNKPYNLYSTNVKR